MQACAFMNIILSYILHVYSGVTVRTSKKGSVHTFPFDEGNPVGPLRSVAHHEILVDVVELTEEPVSTYPHCIAILRYNFKTWLTLQCLFRNLE